MLKWLAATITQGSADAFVQAELQTGLVNLSRMAYRIREIQVSWPNLISTAANNMQVSLTRKSFSAVPSLASQATIFLQNLGRNFGSAVGVSDQALITRYEYPKDLELVVVEDPLYVQLDSAGTSNSNSAVVRVGYEQRQITETERLGLIAASLA